MSLSIRLRQERASLVELMKPLASSKSPADAQRWAQLDREQEALRARIVTAEQSNLDDEMSQVRNVQRPNINSDFEGRTLSPSQEIRSTAQYKRDFDTWLRTGQQSPEMRAIGAAVGADGATLVPQGFEAELEVKMKYWNGIANIARTITTSTGNALPWPTMDDTSNTGEWLAEAAGVGSADPTFSNVILGANLLSSKQVKVSVQLEQDSAFDMASLLLDAFGERLGRAQDTAFATGDGSTIPVTGLITALIAAGGRSALAVGSNANDGVGTDINTVGTDDFAALIDKLDKAYQKPSNYFVFAQSTQNALRKLKDKYGRPVWETSLAQGEPDRIYGYRYVVDNAVAAIGAGNISVLFGDFSKYVIRKALGITLVRFNELYMVNFQRAYQSFLRVDAKLLQPAAFSYLTHPLS